MQPVGNLVKLLIANNKLIPQMFIQINLDWLDVGIFYKSDVIVGLD